MKQENDLHQDLIQWFQIHQRKLPWRKTYEPYHVWVSEIMLQQTRVETVIEYFQRWMESFPSIQALAEAHEDEVLKLWEGLGYYSRARNIHKAAKRIQEEFSGELPRDAKSLSSLSGIGAYTLGAISNIAFEDPRPIVDGNVQRLFSRLFDWEEEISKKKSMKFFEEKSLELNQLGKPRDLSQGLMEMGAMICKPKNPNCNGCPVQRHCLSYTKGTVMQRPNKQKKQSGIPIQVILLVFQDGGEYYLEKQEEKELWAGMWSFPYFRIPEWKGTEEEFAMVRAKEYDASLWDLLPMKSFRHGVTKYKVQAIPYVIPIDERKKFHGKGKWYTREQLNELSLPKASVMIRNALEQTCF